MIDKHSKRNTMFSTSSTDCIKKRGETKHILKYLNGQISFEMKKNVQIL